MTEFTPWRIAGCHATEPRLARMTTGALLRRVTLLASQEKRFHMALEKVCRHITRHNFFVVA
jgi:hypothetical protein